MNTVKNKKMSNADLCIETKVHPELKNYFGYGLFKAGVLYRNLIEKNHINKFGLSASESGILYILGAGDVVNQLTLGHEIGIDKASIVKIIDKLEKLKLVKRDVDSSDRRSRLISLTTKGKNLLDKIKIVRTELEEQVFASFRKEDQLHMRRLVPQILEALMGLK